MSRRLGSYYPCPDSWKIRVREYLDENGISRKEVAEVISCDPSMVTKLLRLSTDTPPGPATSRIALAVSKYTRIPLPVAEWETYDEVISILDALRKRDVALHDHAIALVKQIARPPAKSTESTETVMAPTQQNPRKRRQ